MMTGRWTNEEHQLFLQAVQMHNKDWEKIQKFVKTRDTPNIRAHSQKYVEKIKRKIDRGDGTDEE